MCRPPDASTGMDWTRDATGRTYTCTVGDYQAMIWHTANGAWDALVSQGQVAVAHRRLATLKEAQGWCLIHLAEGVTQERQQG